MTKVFCNWFLQERLDLPGFIFYSADLLIARRAYDVHEVGLLCARYFGEEPKNFGARVPVDPKAKQKCRERTENNGQYSLHHTKPEQCNLLDAGGLLVWVEVDKLS